LSTDIVLINFHLPPANFAGRNLSWSSWKYENGDGDGVVEYIRYWILEFNQRGHKFALHNNKYLADTFLPVAAA